ncbi:hypothetical protein Tdes44962_MAKER01332 [Teratosphaeria destructans]|uniref:Uncharacterized protein n=1 Tax=Teratosphaeria destructans TaxID=418781 RepID=A0A9W7SZR3_9PEZI|nr:hypothetical protein Tdes44962_MAKER01332 [Teratosphaeria destructans]
MHGNSKHLLALAEELQQTQTKRRELLHERKEGKKAFELLNESAEPADAHVTASKARVKALSKRGEEGKIRGRLKCRHYLLMAAADRLGDEQRAAMWSVFLLKQKVEENRAEERRLWGIARTLARPLAELEWSGWGNTYFLNRQLDLN